MVCSLVRDISKNSTPQISYALATQRERDGESSLMHYRARSYDPRLGRFVQKDPQDRVMEHYKYAKNNPVIFRDPLGLQVSEQDLRPFGVGPEASAFIKSINPKTGLIEFDGGQLPENMAKLMKSRTRGPLSWEVYTVGEKVFAFPVVSDFGDLEEGGFPKSKDLRASDDKEKKLQSMFEMQREVIIGEGDNIQPETVAQFAKSIVSLSNHPKYANRIIVRKLIDFPMFKTALEKGEMVFMSAHGEYDSQTQRCGILLANTPVKGNLLESLKGSELGVKHVYLGTCFGNDISLKLKENYPSLENVKGLPGKFYRNEGLKELAKEMNPDTGFISKSKEGTGKIFILGGTH